MASHCIENECMKDCTNDHVARAHLRSSASIAGHDVNRLYKRRLGQLPCERVLTAAIANEEDTQLGGRHGGWYIWKEWRAERKHKFMLCFRRSSLLFRSALIHPPNLIVEKFVWRCRKYKVV